MRISRLAAAAAFTLAAAGAAAALPKPKALAIMHERHEGMEAIGEAVKSIRRELDANSPNLATVRRSAGQIAKLSRKSRGWFPAGTGPETGKTRAKPEIWKDPKDFSTKLSSFQKAATALNNAAGSRDVNALKTHFRQLGQTCKACHDPYRAEKH